MKNSNQTSMPAIFIGHGNPMLTIGDNHYTRSWKELGHQLPQPKAILVISAHWYVPEMRVTAMQVPRTIHDFYGFPEELFQIEYPAPGNPELAEQVADLLSPDHVSLDQQWGLDHGTWSVLRHIYPRAQVPVIQLSLDLRKSPEDHYRLGQQLSKLRKEGVLIVSSGNIVHNLSGFNWGDPSTNPSDWAVEFEEWNRSKLLGGDSSALVEYLATGKMATLSAPSPDHYLPLLYLAAVQEPADEVSFPVEGFDGGTMSMLSVLLTSHSPSE
jgi:4,5-DOPA dioxygenase extradiol